LRRDAQVRALPQLRLLASVPLLLLLLPVKSSRSSTQTQMMMTALSCRPRLWSQHQQQTQLTAARRSPPPPLVPHAAATPLRLATSGCSWCLVLCQSLCLRKAALLLRRTANRVALQCQHQQRRQQQETWPACWPAPGASGWQKQQSGPSRRCPQTRHPTTTMAATTTQTRPVLLLLLLLLLLAAAAAAAGATQPSCPRRT
jgi:hypothetical protein